MYKGIKNNFETIEGREVIRIKFRNQAKKGKKNKIRRRKKAKWSNIREEQNMRFEIKLK